MTIRAEGREIERKKERERGRKRERERGERKKEERFLDKTNGRNGSNSGSKALPESF